ncbi:hypothetical protein GCM10009775_24310 [Microbacterium aoyamense]|uniref:Uncharacterized protein n=1 Tax=Microbacterium aoyamense TaxID=344166 RepID=A0ABP5B648_9MICO
MILRRALAAREGIDVEVIGETILDGFDDAIESGDHGSPFNDQHSVSLTTPPDNRGPMRSCVSSTRESGLRTVS